MVFCFVCSIQFCVGVTDSGVRWAVSLVSFAYSYLVGTTIHASRELGIYNRVPTLYLSNDLTGTSYQDANFKVQRIQTYSIGLAINNQMLQDAAEYGLGKSYTANNSAQLQSAFENARIDLQTAQNDLARQSQAFAAGAAAGVGATAAAGLAARRAGDPVRRAGWPGPAPIAPGAAGPRGCAGASADAVANAVHRVVRWVLAGAGRLPEGIFRVTCLANYDRWAHMPEATYSGAKLDASRPVDRKSVV